MNPNLTTAASTIVAPKLLKNFKFSWLVYGAAAYYGLKLLSKQGIFPKQTGAAVDLIDRGIDLAKQQIGLGNQSSIASNLPH